MYAARSDMELAFGLGEVVKLTDRSRSGNVDDTALNQALSRASSEIDSYLGGRYRLPLAADVIPSALTDRCCDIARFKLCGSGGVQVTEEIRARYDDAIRFLEQVASGRVRLGAGEVGTPQVSNAARFHSGGRQFGRDKTNGGAF